MKQLSEDRWVLLACWHSHHAWYVEKWVKWVNDLINNCLAKCNGDNMLCAHQNSKRDELCEEIKKIVDLEIRERLLNQMQAIHHVIVFCDRRVAQSYEWWKAYYNEREMLPPYNWYLTGDLRILLFDINRMIFYPFIKKIKNLSPKKRLKLTWLIQDVQNKISEAIIYVEKILIEELSKQQKETTVI